MKRNLEPLRHYQQERWSTALLRRIADTIEQRSGIEVQDVILHSEVTADGDWWSATVNFHDRSL